MIKNSLDNSEYYINRELSWLEFNDRVFREACDKTNPLLERAKFLSIVSSNLDEFFMVRVASLKDQINAGYQKPDASGLTPMQQLNKISERTHRLVKEQYRLYNHVLLPALAEAQIILVNQNDLTSKQKSYLDEYFRTVIYPVLTPMAVDSSRPFPLIQNKSLNLGTIICDRASKNQYIFSTVQVPSVLPRVVEIPADSKNKKNFILLEEIISIYIEELFTGHEVICTFPYRITRNADLTLAEEEAEDLLKEIEKSLKKRKWGAAVRLEVSDNMEDKMVQILKEALEITSEDVYRIPGPLDLTFLMKIYQYPCFEHLKYPDLSPQVPQDLLGEDNIFDAVRKKDVFLHHPYESFEPVVDFIKKAADDPNVLAIKQTLYRVSGDSPIVAALAEAAERGKQVTVLVELKARFDEENNIHWAKRLEQSGCHVIYGLVGLKTHCKIILIVRLEEDGIKRYVHLGTGNYNDITARFYTDMGLLTCNEYMCTDASSVFNMLSGYSEPPGFYKFEVAPLTLRYKFLSLIERERENALAGNNARIIAKMNSLVDKQIIKALYRASEAGVKIDLIVRGICCLRPGLPGISDNIIVRSLVGRYLEHSRIYYFYNNGEKEVYLSSADWMPRNLDRRVELLFPIENKLIKNRIIDILQIILDDTAKTRILQPDGKYKKVIKRGRKQLNSQEYFGELALKQTDNFKKEKDNRIFEAITSLPQD